jgi:cell division protein FtsA
MIEPGDIRTVCDLAKSKELPSGRMVVHNIRRPFRVDGRLVPGNPENLIGQRLEVGYWTVHGQEKRLADNIHVIRGFNLEVRELVLASLASGHMITSPGGAPARRPRNRHRRGHDGLRALPRRRAAHHRRGAGRRHALTNDLSIGLRLTEGQAEKLKLRFGRASVRTKDKGAEGVARRQFCDRRPAVSPAGDRADHVGPRVGDCWRSCGANSVRPSPRRRALPASS